MNLDYRNKYHLLLISLRAMLLEVSVAVGTGLTVSRLGGSGGNPWFGEWTIPLTFLFSFVFYYLFKSYPNIKYHLRSLDEFGGEYERELINVIEESGWRWMFITNWFRKYYEKRISKREGLDIRKFVLGDEDSKK